MSKSFKISMISSLLTFITALSFIIGLLDIIHFSQPNYKAIFIYLCVGSFSGVIAFIFGLISVDRKIFKLLILSSLFIVIGFWGAVLNFYFSILVGLSFAAH